MDWQLQLISDYIEIENSMQCSSVPRRWRRKGPDFSDSEILAIYFFGLRYGLRNVKSIHLIASTVLSNWFPMRPCYEQYLRRINRLGSYCKMLCTKLYELEEQNYPEQSIAIDFAPVAIAKQVRSTKSKVAKNICDKGYNKSKKGFFYGFKLHVASLTSNRSPYQIVFAEITPASVHDNKVLYRIMENFNQRTIYADKSYCSEKLASLAKSSGNQLITPIKKPKGRGQGLDSLLINSLISSTRQVIETTFGWLDRKCGLFQANHLRSSKGIVRHVYASLLGINLGLV